MIEPDVAFSDFASAYDDGRAQVVWARVPGDIETPVSAMLKLGRDRANAVLLESIEGGAWRGRFSAIGIDPDLVWRVRAARVEVSRGADVANGRFVETADDAIASLRLLLEESAIALPSHLSPLSAGVFGYLGYPMVAHIERVGSTKPDPLDLPDAMLVRPTIVIVFDALTQDMVLVTPVRPADGKVARAAYDAAVSRLHAISATLSENAPVAGRASGSGEAVTPKPSMADGDYHSMVETAKAYIRAGDVFQVVPSQRYEAALPAPPFALYRALRRLNPSPFLFYLNFGGFAVVGSSPEILVRLRADTVTIRPIAGTRPRGATPEEDAANEAALLNDPKERAEHLMLLDLGRNDVGRVARPGTVRVTDQFSVERYSHVMHIASNVEGRLRDDKDVVDALFAGFPAGTVSGAPKVRAMEIIAEMEPERRALYAGGVGYFSAGGDMDTCIALRTAVVKDGVMHVQAGGGVVYDSDPETERLETVHKAGALFRAAAEAARFA